MGMKRRNLSGLFLIIFMIFAMEMVMMGEARGRVRTCKTPSARFKGPCLRKSNCKSACQLEGFHDGDCDFHVVNRKCFCYGPCH